MPKPCAMAGTERTWDMSRYRMRARRITLKAWTIRNLKRYISACQNIAPRLMDAAALFVLKTEGFTPLAAVDRSGREGHNNKGR